MASVDVKIGSRGTNGNVARFHGELIKKID